jgi:hypothetical protein
VTRGRHLRRHRTGIVRATFALAVAMAVVAVGAQFVGTAPARATGGGGGGSGGGGQTVETIINIPALPLTNLCNADIANLSGDARLRVTTTPHRNGGYTVRSSFNARNLRGERIAPPPPIGYHGDNVENTYSYYAPAGGSSHRVYHWTRLVPEARAPTMYLVVVIRETILADGTVVPVAERAYLVCRQPRCWHERA